MRAQKSTKLCLLQRQTFWKLCASRERLKCLAKLQPAKKIFIIDSYQLLCKCAFKIILYSKGRKIHPIISPFPHKPWLVFYRTRNTMFASQQSEDLYLQNHRFSRKCYLIYLIAKEKISQFHTDKRVTKWNFVLHGILL